MITHPGFAGIDISKQYFDVFDGAVGKHERLANGEAGALLLALCFKASNSFVLFEATGRYDRLHRLALGDVGVTFSRVNPKRAQAGPSGPVTLPAAQAASPKPMPLMPTCWRPWPRPSSHPSTHHCTSNVRFYTIFTQAGINWWPCGRKKPPGWNCWPTPRSSRPSNATSPSSRMTSRASMLIILRTTAKRAAKRRASSGLKAKSTLFMMVT